MDRGHLESHLGLRPDLAWLRPLLCPDVGQAAESYGPAEIPDRRRPPHLRARVWCHAPSRRAARAAQVAQAAEGLRRQHGRRPAREGSGRLPRAGLGGHGPDAAAHLPGPDQASRALRARPRRPLPLRRRARSPRREVDLLACWPLANVWLGTSIESDDYVRRADALRAAPAATRFLSLEPLLGPLPSLNLAHIDWVIVGGESGPGHRP